MNIPPVFFACNLIVDSTSITPSIYEPQNMVKIFMFAAIIGCYLIYRYVKKLNKKSLMISESNYKQLFNNLADQIFMVDLKGSIIEVNEMMCRQLGYTRNELLKSSPRHFDEKYRQNALSRMEELRKNGLTLYETTYLTKARKLVPVEVNSKLINYNGRNISLNIVRNISDRKQFEDRIICLQNHSLLISEADTLEKVAYATNSTLTEGFGFDHASFYIKNGDEMNLVSSTKKSPMGNIRCDHECPVTGAILEKKSILVDNKRVQGQYKNKQLDTLCELNVPVIVDGVVEGLLCLENDKPSSINKEEKNLVETLGMNITSTLSRLKSTEKMKESEERHRGIVENIESVIILTDIDGEIKYVSPSSLKVFGYSPDKLHGSLASFIHPQDRQRVQQVLTDELAVETHAELEYRIFTKKKKVKWVSHNLRETSSKETYLNVITDITWRKEAEKELTEYTRFLERAKSNLKDSIEELEETNQDLDEFTRIVSHDLKAPLRSIIMFSSFIKDNYKDKVGDDGAMYIDRMSDAAKRMTVLIEDLLTLSRVGRKNLDVIEVDLNNMVEVIKMDLEALIEEKKAQVVHHELPLLVTQRVWIKQLFTNLINNGIKFNESETPTIEIHYEDRYDNHYFEVSDNGIGIDPGDHDRLFKVFSRLHTGEEYQGTGAGLSICKKIVKSLGGTIGLRSAIGEGSTFFFSLPKHMENNNKSNSSEFRDELNKMISTI